MKVSDNAKNEQKKEKKGSRQNLILAIAALLVMGGIGIYSRLPISTGQPFKFAIGTAVLDPRTAHGQDFFDNGFVVKEFKPMDQGDVLNPDDKIGTKMSVISCNISLDGVKLGNVMLKRTSDYGTAAKKCKADRIVIYLEDDNKDLVRVEGIEQEPVLASDLTMERLTAALGEYTDSGASMGDSDDTDYTWKRKHYSLTVSCEPDDTLKSVEIVYK